MAREALATAKTQPVASLVTIIIVAGMCTAVHLTTGRTVGAEAAVLESIDSAGTRSIIIRADAVAGLDTSVLDRISDIRGIEWAGAFGPAEDVTNSAIPSGARVPIRVAWSDDFASLGVPGPIPLENRMAWASSAALDQLGMPDSVGGVSSASGAEYAIAGQIPVPDYLAFLEPFVVAPQTSDASGSVSVLVVIVSRPDLVSPVALAVQSVLDVDDPSKVKVITSETLAELRAVVEGQLGSFGRNLVIVIFALTAVLVSAILYGLAIMRRKEYGRRRALGASQRLIVVLLLIQMAASSLLGVLVGSAAAAIGLVASGDALPGIDFFAAVGILAVSVGVAAALLPAVAASRRDPLTELRVP